MSTSPEETLEHVRALSEGRAPKKYLRLEPLRDRVLVPRPSGEFEELPVIRLRSRQSVVEFYDKFQEATTGEFSTATFARFAMDHGYDGDQPTLRSYISKRKADGDIRALRRDGHGYVFEFA